MYINPYHVQLGLRQVVVDNIDIIGGEIRRFFSNKTLNIFVGRRQTIPVSHMPSFEIISQGVTPEWYASRTQNARFRLELLLTLQVTKEENIDQMLGTIATALVAVLTNPASLQFSIQSEQRVEQPAPLGLEYIRNYNRDKPSAERLNWVAPEPDETKRRRMFDSFITDVTFNTGNGGAFAQANMQWEGQILQKYIADWNYFVEMLTPGNEQEFEFEAVQS